MIHDDRLPEWKLDPPTPKGDPCERCGEASEDLALRLCERCGESLIELCPDCVYVCDAEDFHAICEREHMNMKARRIV